MNIQFIYFLQTLLSTIKQTFLSYKVDYIHIFLKPLATTPLLSTNAITVTLNCYIKIQFETYKISGYIIQQIMKDRGRKLYGHKFLNYMIGINGYITFQALTPLVHDCWWPSVLAVRHYSSQCISQQITVM